MTPIPPPSGNSAPSSTRSKCRGPLTSTGAVGTAALVLFLASCQRDAGTPQENSTGAGNAMGAGATGAGNAASAGTAPSAGNTSSTTIASSAAPRFEGIGCPSGAELRPLDPEFANANQPGLFEFTFSRFELAGAQTQAASAACTVQVAFSIPAGKSLRLVGGEWSGEAALATPGAVKIRREYRLSGAAPLAREIDLDPGFKGTFFFKDDMREALPSADAGWTPCSAQPSEALAQATLSASASGSGTSTKIFFGRAFQIEERSCPPS